MILSNKFIMQISRSVNYDWSRVLFINNESRICEKPEIGSIESVGGNFPLGCAALSAYAWYVT